MNDFEEDPKIKEVIESEEDEFQNKGQTQTQ